MTADVELLPLPEKSEIDRHLPTGVRVYGYTADDMRTYARANVAHATAARDAEVEALVKQRDFLVEEYERAVGCGPQGYTHAAMHLFNAIANAKADENTKAIEALRAEARYALDNAARSLTAARTARDVAEARAERLAEALRECGDDYAHALGLSKQSYQEWCSRGAYGSPPNDTWPIHCQRRKEQIDALLHPTAAQENDDA